MFELYCKLCKEHYSGCFKSEHDKHKNCTVKTNWYSRLLKWFLKLFKRPKKIKFRYVSSIAVSPELAKRFQDLPDIRKILEENSVKDLHELAKDS